MIDKHVRFDSDVVKLVDDWRRGQSPIPSFNTAINTLLRQPKTVYQFPNLPAEDMQAIAKALANREVKEQ